MGMIFKWRARRFVSGYPRGLTWQPDCGEYQTVNCVWNVTMLKSKMFYFAICSGTSGGDPSLPVTLAPMNWSVRALNLISLNL